MASKNSTGYFTKATWMIMTSGSFPLLQTLSNFLWKRAWNQQYCKKAGLIFYLMYSFNFNRQGWFGRVFWIQELCFYNVFQVNITQLRFCTFNVLWCTSRLFSILKFLNLKHCVPSWLSMINASFFVVFGRKIQDDVDRCKLTIVTVQYTKSPRNLNK